MNSPFRTWHEATAGLWRNNIALVQLLGLCPLLAVTTSAVKGLALGLATLAVAVVTSIVMALVRGVLLPSLRVPVYLVLLAALVTCIDLLVNAALDDLHDTLGIFLPLIVVNCALLVHAEAVAGARPFGFTVLSSLATGFGLLAVLVALGIVRELLGEGTVLADAELLIGESGAGLGISLPVGGMLVAVLPPGAFFVMGLLLALHNRLVTRPREGTQ
jgi:electron transport complex protein RnfE